MAKLTYGSTISAIYDPQVGAPLDSRMAVAKFSDLIDITTWKTNGGTSAEAYSYYGMLVYVGQDGDKNGLYTLQPSNIEGKTVKDDTQNASCWVRISQTDARINEIEKKLKPVNYDTENKVWKIDSIPNNGTENTNTIFSVSNDGKISGSSVLWADESVTDITDTHIITKGYLNKKLEEFVPKTQSSISMYITDIDPSGNEEQTGSIAQVRVIRENGIVTFEVDDTQVLSGVSFSNNVLDNLQLNITNKNSDGSLSPTEDIATVSVIRNTKTGKMSIRIS